MIQHLPNYKNFQIDVLRLDLSHPLYGGNKYFKLKYNIEKALYFDYVQRDAIEGKLASGGHPEPFESDQDELGRRTTKTILTFGGAHSNHIYATAAYCHEQKVKSIGVIRGEESMIAKSPTLQFAQLQGMHLHFISRENYKNKTNNDFVNELKNEFGNFHLIPEGGNNEDGIKGCSEILNDVPFYDYVFCACGTGCTYSGILSTAKSKQIIVGISVLKGESELRDEVNVNSQKFGFIKIIPYEKGLLNHSTILNNYHFGGYAKHSQELLQFKLIFEQETTIPLDYVYTAKLFYAAYDLIDKQLLVPNKRVLVIHSGGQQGNAGYQSRYKLNA